MGLNARRHHFVPAFYLRRFAAKDNRIGVYRREGRKRFVAHVNSVAAQVGFYTISLKDGTRSEHVEQILSRVEAEAAPALDRLVKCGAPATPADREALSLFLALQLVRGRRERDHELLLMDFVEKLSIAGLDRDEVRGRLAENGKIPTEEEVEQAYDVAKNPNEYRILPENDTEIIVTLLQVATQNLAPVIHHKCWILARSQSECFISSDEPVVFWRKPNRYGHTGVGLETADEVRIPLDPRHTLILLNERLREDVCDLPRSLIRDMNRVVALNSYEQVFHHPHHRRALEGIELEERRPAATIHATGFPMIAQGDLYAMRGVRR